MPDTPTTADRVRTIIAEHLGAPLEKITDDANLIDDLGADSLDIIEMMMVIDDDFGTDTLDDEMDRLRTAGNVITCVEGKL